MKIILSGDTGFVGKCIKSHLKDEEIIGISRSRSAITANLPFNCPTLPKADLVIHAAGLAHLGVGLKSNRFFQVNVEGSKLFLSKLAQNVPSAFVFISSVAVYGCESGDQICEDFPLLAEDGYGRSKVLCEEIIADWCKSRGVICTILRLPLLVGPNANGNLKFLVEGIRNGYYFNVGGGRARRSMVLIEDVAKLILPASKVGGVYNLTDGVHPTFSEISSHIAAQLGKSPPKNISFGLARFLARVGDCFPDRAPLTTQKLIKIVNSLTFDDSKAREILQWNPRSVLEGFKIQ